MNQTCKNHEMKPIPGYEDTHLISDEGEVWSFVSNKWLKHLVSSDGYHMVRLFRGDRSGAFEQLLISRLVLQSFVGPPPDPKYNAAHLDDNRHNNRVSNLEWKTHQQNVIEAQPTTVRNRGEAVPTSKVTEDEVITIRQMYSVGSSIAELARMFKVTETCIRYIVKYKTWGRVA